MITSKEVIINEHLVTVVDVKTSDIELSCMSLGATITDLKTKDKHGQFESIIMQFEQLADYDHNPLFLNHIIGPTPGRMPAKDYEIAGDIITLDANDGKAHLHGGANGYCYHNFDVEIVKEPNLQIHFKKTFDDNIYPGEQAVHIIYTIKNNQLIIDFNASSTKETLMNLTQHMYFNLSGNLSTDILDHSLRVTADRHLALDENFIPHHIESVTNTHLDFREVQPIKTHLTPDVLNRPEKGIDNPLLFSDTHEIRYYDPTSQRQLDITTTYPCVVVYTDNHDNNYPFKHMSKRRLHSGICFETQLAPNGSLIDGVAGTTLTPNKAFNHQTTYTFTVNNS